MSSILVSLVSLTALLGSGIPQATSNGPYHIIRTEKLGGDGGFDYVYADSEGRKIYVPRTGANSRVMIVDLDTFAMVGQIDKTNARGAATDAKTHHGFASSKPVAMWDTHTLKVEKTIPVDGRPDGILNDSFNHRVYIFSHSAPNATVIDAKSGDVLGTIDLGGAPEQAVSDGKGHVYVDLEDKGSVAVIDAKAMKLQTTYSLNGKGDGCAGLALDAKHNVLFVACREPQVMVMLDAKTGKYLADLPLAGGSDGAVFNPKTGEAFSSHGNGTLSVIKETSPTTFEVEQTVQTMPGAKTLSLDAKTGHIILIAAEYATPGAGQVEAGARQRRQMVPNSFSIVVVGK
jgi:DNA-binding beta-propeller fold protein YncE